MRVLVLGSGTSAGVPTLGCKCEVCTSPNPLNRRTRASIVVEDKGVRLLVDCGPDFRTQALANGIDDVSHVLLTHTHADHVNGLDDLRAFNMINKHPVHVYAEDAALQDIQTRFAYCFRPAPPGGAIPELLLETITVGTLVEIEGLKILPIRVMHGSLPILGCRIGKFAYLTDISTLPDESVEMLQGLDVLITGALRHKEHPTHMSLGEATKLAERLKVPRVWFTHMSHDLEHEATNNLLPDGMKLSFDGLEITV